MPLGDAKTDVFIVRIWLEPREDVASDKIWRGRVEHLGTSEARYFQDLVTLEAFISRHTGILDEDA